MSLSRNAAAFEATRDRVPRSTFRRTKATPAFMSDPTLDPADETGAGEDYTNHVVPASARKSHAKMLLTFLSMQATFPAVYVGYTARYEGLKDRKSVV